MPYANNDGVRIYYEVEGHGPALVLMHPGFGGIQSWRLAGWPDELSSDYKLILLDGRGYGASDKPHDPEAYRPQSYVEDIVGVLDDVGVAKAHYLGYSLGGHVGWGVALRAPHRVRSLSIGGCGDVGIRDDDYDYGWAARVLAEGTLIEMMQEGFGSRWTPEVESMARSIDLDAQLARVSGEEYLRGLPRFSEWLPTVTIPCLLFTGEDDAPFSDARQAANTVVNGTFVPVVGCDHFEAFFRPDLILPHVRRFLAEVGED